MSSSLAEKIALRTSHSREHVESVLLKHNVVDSPTPPVARPLRVRKLEFSGRKTIHGETKPISFSWEPHRDGANAIATDSNFAGKSSILQVMLWAIRGETKTLTTTVEGWIEHVMTELEAGDRRLRVQFDVVNDIPHGSVDLLTKDGEISHSLEFESADMFKVHMNRIMLDALALEPIAASREVASQEKTVLYADGWAAYTGALLFDSDSSALIGEHTGTNLTQRLLQVFLGMPWATTLFQARAAKRVAESMVQGRKRRLAGLGGQSVDVMQARLKEIARQIADGTAKEMALAQLDAARRRFDALSGNVSALQAAVTAVSGEAESGVDELNKKKRELLEIEEEQVATMFLGRLSPTCCPRCATTFDKSRLDNERKAGSCSVCLTAVSQDAPVDYDALKAAVSKDVKRLARLVGQTNSKAEELRRSLETARGELGATADELAKLSAGGTAQEEQKLRLEAARLEGMLDAISKLVEADSGESADLEVLSVAEDIASDEVGKAAEAVLERSGELVCSLVRRLGMEDVEQVVLKRNANVDLIKGGSKSTFSSLSPGERLRVRIATVVALLQAAEQHGVGRHPGLIIIDSPANEEMADANVEQMLGSLSELSETVPVQLFVAFKGTKRALEHFDESRCLLAEGDSKLW